MRRIFFQAFTFKLIFTFLILSFGTQNSNAQDNNSGVFPTGVQIRTSEVSLNCNIPRPQTGCNYITNNTFTPSSSYYIEPAYSDANRYYPFHINDPANPSLSLIPEWGGSHGSPQVFDGIQPYLSDPLPFMGSGYARMASSHQFPPGGTGGEGIVQKIPPLRAGNKYVLSFFKKIDSYQTGWVPDQLKIVFTNCSFSQTFDPNPLNWTTPTLLSPPSSQIVYCEQNLNNASWQQVVINFTANGNYDMIMIFPEQNPIQSLGITLLSFPELIDMITAGSSPNPTPGNCVVTIGPTTPNCGVRNAVFTWHGPNGQTIPAPSNQQIQVDTNNPQNVGNWSLTMTIPGVTITNSLCSQQGPVSATVYVPSCTGIISFWPKIYEAIESNGIKIDNNGNIFSAMFLQNMNNNINHQGVTTNATGDHYVHYDISTDMTNWICTDWVVGLPMSGGITNFLDDFHANVYRNGTSGALVSGPAIPSNVELLAEDNGGFIAKDGYNLRSYNSSGTQISTIPIPVISGYLLDQITRIAIYSPINQSLGRLFVCYWYYNGSGSIFRIGIYDFDLTNYTLSSVAVPYDQINGPIVQVNNAEKIFVFRNQVLEEYDIQTGQYYPLAMSNFVNNNLEEVSRSNHLVEDRIIIKGTNPTEKYFYCINTSTNTATKISYTPPSTLSQFYSYYLFDGNDVYISGEYSGSGFSIGSQSLPLLGSGSAFITKFPLTDFSRSSSNKSEETVEYSRNSSSLAEKTIGDLSLFPNPAKQTLQVTLNNVTAKENSTYFISVLNQVGVKIYTTFSSSNTTTLDISHLKPGFYYINVISGIKNIATKAFLKN